MATAVEKTPEELRREIQELQRQHREISERLRDPRGLRRGAPAAAGPGGPRPLRGFPRPGVDLTEQPSTKRRILSAVVKVEDTETKEDVEKDAEAEGREDGLLSGEGGERRGASNGGFRRDGSQRVPRRNELDMPLPEPLPREFPKDEDPSLVKRNRRMLGKLLVGTLEKFQQEDKKLSSTEAYMRRSETQRKADQKAREESEKLRQQEREQAIEKRKRDMMLRARVAAKAEEKRLELLFMQWAEHHKRLSNFLRTNAEPPIYYIPAKPLTDDPAIANENKEKAFQEWKAVRRAELTQFQKQVEEHYMSNVERQLERMQNARNARRGNGPSNMQEMDKELETHRAEHGPKTRRVPEDGNDDEEDIEDMAVEDELMDEVLGINEPINDDPTKPSEEAADGAPVSEKAH
uniref:Pinin/SDK/MemA protein domain-containing protein n=1 Tax=Leersia perrieri TaxID=77586 RepID=A0A0D9VXX3_9ORYZ